MDEAGKCQNLKIVYFYEMIHYLEKACNVTVDLCKFKNKYIRTDGAPRGVDVYRLENMIDLLKEMIVFSCHELDNLDIVLKHRKNVEQSIKSIQLLIREEIEPVVHVMQ